MPVIAATIIAATSPPSDGEDVPRLIRTSTGIQLDGHFIEANEGRQVLAQVTLDSGDRALVGSPTTHADESGGLFISFVVTSEAVDLSWNRVSDETAYVIARDGVELDETTNNTWRDASPLDRTATYSVGMVGASPVTLEFNGRAAKHADLDHPERIDRKVRLMSRPATQAPPALEIPGNQTSIIRVPSLGNPDTEHRTSDTDFTSIMVDMTSFLPDTQYLARPCTFDGGWDGYFLGDDRSFANPDSVESLRNRLRQRVLVAMLGTDVAFVTQGVSTGQTHLYNEDDELVETRQASTEHAEVTVEHEDVNFVKFHMFHAASVPFCDYGGPTTQGILAGVQVYVSGPPAVNISVQGSGRPAPSQQLDFSVFTDPPNPNDHTWVRIWQAESGPIACLVAALCASRSIS